MPPKKKRNPKAKKKVTKNNNVSDEEIEEEPASQEQSLYDTLEKKKFSANLFVIEGRPMVFYIAPCEPKSQISDLIVKGGGLVQKYAKDGIITLVETKSDLPAKIPKECYSINYITDSILDNKRVEIAKYSVKLNKKAAKRDSFSSPRTRIIFTKEDDKKLVDFVNNHGEFTPSGSKLWQLAEEKLDGGHTWQSMRSRYLKVVRKLNFNSDGEGEEEFNGDHVDEDKDDRDHSQSKNKRKNDRHDDNNHVKKKSKKDETDEGESSDDLNETSNKKAKLQAEESFIEADYLDHIQNDDDDNEEEDGDVDDILTQEISKPRTNIHSKKSDNKNNNKKNYDDDENDNNNDNDDNESDENVKDKSYVKEIVLSVINNLMLTTKLPKSVVVHGLIVNNGVVSDTIQYLNNPQEFYHSRSKSAQIWTYTEDKILLDKHERGLEDLANTRGPKSIQNRQLFLES